MSDKKSHYYVLARKYRPKVFDDLIGQQGLVQTLTNAIQNNRLAQAYILTGIRGVGKTSSARIIARALNCVGADGKGGMTPQPCGVCPHCVQIANDCHVDVIEIDAASNTGVDNVREIIEGAKYKPLSARYKVYIIDEVHMLSKAAFNALLKTLEEPPAHVKFIFATTEIRKVPMTILSRCQRFDLRRIEIDELSAYFRKVMDKEGLKIDDDALRMIAVAADGSVRDGLSLLDQAIVYGGDTITTDTVRQMIGYTDRTALISLYQHLMAGQIEEVLKAVRAQYREGVDGAQLILDMMDWTHFLTCLKIAPACAEDASANADERTKATEMAKGLSMGVLTRTWQILLKGLNEIKTTESPEKTLEMLMIRLSYAAELPTPLDAAKMPAAPVAAAPAFVDSAEKKTEKIVKEKAPAVASTPAAATKPVSVSDLAELVALAKKAGQMMLAFNLSAYVRPVRMTDGTLEVNLIDGAPEGFLQNVRAFLLAQTGKNWRVETVPEQGDKTLKERAAENKAQVQEQLSHAPLVEKVLHVFSPAHIETIRKQVLADEDNVLPPT